MTPIANPEGLPNRAAPSQEQILRQCDGGFLSSDATGILFEKIDEDEVAHQRNHPSLDLMDAKTTVYFLDAQSMAGHVNHRAYYQGGFWKDGLEVFLLCTPSLFKKARELEGEENLKKMSKL